MKYKFTQNKPLDLVPGEKNGLQQLTVTTDLRVEPDVFVDAEVVANQTLGVCLMRCVMTRSDGKKAIAFFNVSVKNGMPIFTVSTKVHDRRDTISASKAGDWMVLETP